MTHTYKFSSYVEKRKAIRAYTLTSARFQNVQLKYLNTSSRSIALAVCLTRVLTLVSPSRLLSQHQWIRQAKIAHTKYPMHEIPIQRHSKWRQCDDHHHRWQYNVYLNYKNALTPPLTHSLAHFDARSTHYFFFSKTSINVHLLSLSLANSLSWLSLAARWLSCFRRTI